MLENISDNVFFKTINESPKFRHDTIVASITIRPMIVDKVVEIYKLNLVMEVYFQDISIKSYNSNKRNKLKAQEILLIKKVKIAEIAKGLLDEVFENAISYENQFRDHFDIIKSVEEDQIFVKSILDDFYEDYIKQLN